MHPFSRKSSETRLPGWREYQAGYTSARKSKRRWWLVVLVVLAMGGLFYMGFGGSASTAPTPPVAAATIAKEAGRTDPPLISREDARVLLSQLSPDQINAPITALPFKGRDLSVATSLDMELQAYLIKSMDLKNSRYIGIVVMEADTGRVLVLAGFDKTESGGNPCLGKTFPAASLFKIVTAAAAVEKCGYDADTRLKFNGYKHTLYKNQLKDQTNQYTNVIRFKDAFAQSVNPVFGKLGTLRLGRAVLAEYAAAFGFNRPIDFELAVTPSRFSINDDPYHWAEIASGFNNDTAITPLHGAMIASAVINGGRMVAPTIIDRISDPDGTLIYQSRPLWQGQAMAPQTADTVAKMMQATVLKGTGRKVFSGLRRHATLSHLEIGGKTGSIFNRAHDARFDWFVGYARAQKGRKPLAVSVLVAHEEYIGIRAGQYARMAMTRFFEDRIAHIADGRHGSGG